VTLTLVDLLLGKGFIFLIAETGLPELSKNAKIISLSEPPQCLPAGRRTLRTELKAI